MPRRGISRFCFEKLLSHSTEKFRRGAILCFTKWHPKILWKRGRGEGVSYFSVKNFWSKRQKFSYGNPSVRHYFRVSKKFMLQRVYVTILCRNFFVSQYRKKFIATLRCVGKPPVSKNLMQGGDHDFPLKIFVSQCQKIRRRTFLCLTKFLLSKNFIDKSGEGGSITILCLKIHVSVPTNFVWEPFSMSLFSGIE